MKSAFKKYTLLAGIAVLVVSLDQITKTFIRQNLAVGQTWMPWEWLAPYARFVHWLNDGVVFGLFQGRGDIFIVLTITVIVAIIYFYPRIPESDQPLRIALAMQASGAVGNLIDRLTLGHVIDFISVGNFPVFNVADSSITLGVGVLLIGLYMDERKKMKEEKQEDSIDEEISLDEPVEAHHE